MQRGSVVEAAGMANDQARTGRQKMAEVLLMLDQA